MERFSLDFVLTRKSFVQLPRRDTENHSKSVAVNDNPILVMITMNDGTSLMSGMTSCNMMTMGVRIAEGVGAHSSHIIPSSFKTSSLLQKLNMHDSIRGVTFSSPCEASACGRVNERDQIGPQSKMQVTVRHHRRYCKSQI